jgi:hypothetical protein
MNDQAKFCKKILAILDITRFYVSLHSKIDGQDTNLSKNEGNNEKRVSNSV